MSVAVSRRSALRGSAVAALGLATGVVPAQATPTRSSNDLRLVELAEAYEALERRCDEHAASYRGRGTKASDAEFDVLASGVQPLEDEMAETPADTMVGAIAKARACQNLTLRSALETVSLSIADDLWRLVGGGANA